MKIQPVQNDDLLHLARIEKELFGADAFGPFLLYSYLEDHLLFDKILDGTTLAGFGIITLFNPAVLNPHEIQYIEDMQNENRKVAHLVDFAVRKKYWNRGYGTTLLQHLITKLMDKGFEFLYLEVDSSNTRALQFYTHHSFKEIGTIHSYYSNAHDAKIMLKQLERFS